MRKYDFKKIEKKWQKRWREKKIYEPDLEKAKKPFYNLMMFPYPSAEGLHVGNMYPYTGADIYGRMKRMQGYDVFEPIGLDGFGIHSENYALKIGAHPMDQAKISEKRFYKQLEMIGNGFAWDEKLETYNPEYYKWTQWIFTEMFRRGLAYRKRALVNWCPSCKTVLADEQVVAGKCERCSHEVIKKELEQWFFKTTKYADRLLSNLERIDWSERVKIAQKNWIGKSEGAEIEFPLNFSLSSGEVVFASNNKGKLRRMQKLFKAAGVDIVLKIPKDIGVENFDVVEDGSTLRENAEKKARALADKTNLPIFADDSGFFVDGAEIDPVAVKRNALSGADEKTLIVEEIAKKMQKYYQNIASSRGGRVDSEWRNAMCLMTPDKFVMHVETARPTILTDEVHGVVDPHLPLRGLYISKTTGKYVLEQTEEEEMEELQPITNGIKKLFTPTIKVFTTRPDTLFGATYMVLGPEHALIKDLESRIENLEEVKKYVSRAKQKTNEERVAEKGAKTGVELKGVKAINLATKEEIPVWVADYVLGNVGTGAIMAVPAHDERDFEFAKKYKLPIKKVIEPPRIVPEPVPGRAVPDTKIVSDCWTGPGTLINSGKFDGLDLEKARWEIIKFVGGTRKAQYHLRDWLISRQRYWGPPIPMIYCEKCDWQPVPEKDLPVKLPHIKNFRPLGKEGKSPLASVRTFYETKCPKCGGKARRETDVSDTFLDSAWYFYRYIDHENKGEIFDKKRAKHWLPVHMYIGGAEHSVLHLLYSRFLAMVFTEWGLVDFKDGEPFEKFRAHGLLISEGAKMSKSKGNVVNPDEYIEKFGADTLRMYLMFLGPFDQGGDFQDSGILGITRFLERVWKLFHEAGVMNSESEKVENSKLEKLLHQTIKKVTEDIEKFRFNTAISALMILLNEIEKESQVSIVHCQLFLKLLHPFAPHIGEELWEELGYKDSVGVQTWPTYDPKRVKEDTFELVIQINGKHRATKSTPKGISQKDAEEVALSISRIKELLEKQKIKKVIFVSDRLINFVV